MNITYDRLADARNWLRIKETYPDAFTITEYYPFDRGIELRKETLEDIAKAISPTDVSKFTEQALVLEKEWSKIEPQVLRAMFSYLGKELEPIQFKVNLTTAYLMPYDERHDWFMVPTHKSVQEQLRCMAHELFHLYHTRQSPASSRTEREEEVGRFLAVLNL